MERDAEGQDVDFILTDLHPHITAWKQARDASEYGALGYVPAPVDAARATKEILELAQAGKKKDGRTARREKQSQKKMFRLFSLAFHHFDDDLAVKILRNTLQTSDGFAIFELQGRDVGNLFTVLAMAPVLMAGSWWWFWGQWTHLFWTYIIPVVPFVLVYDGLVSCLRTRREGEIMALLRKASSGIDGGWEGWTFEVGEELHTWPGGTISYFVGVKSAE